MNIEEMIKIYGVKIILALAIIVIGFWIVSLITSTIKKALSVKGADETLKSFVTSLIGWLLKATVIISALGMLGIQTTSIMAILGSLGLAIGLSLKDSLSNFAGGVIILLFKPFKVGDSIEGAGQTGTVVAVHIFNTELKTADNKKIIVPNGALANGSIVNYNANGTRRVDLVFGIGYGDDLLKAKELFQRLVKEDSRILEDPAATVAVGALADSSVNFNVRAWVNASDYWGVYSDLLEKAKLELDKAGISIPFPQTDIHLHQVK